MTKTHFFLVLFTSLIHPFAFGDAVSHEVLVKVSRPSDLNAFLELANKQNLVLSNKQPILTVADGIWYKAYLPNSDVNLFMDETKFSLAGMRTHAIEPNHTVTLDLDKNSPEMRNNDTLADPPIRTQPPQTPNGPDSLKSQQWAVAKLNMAKVWSANTSQLPKTIVADIDTGIDYNHDDLFLSLWNNNKEVAGDKKDNDSNGYVDDVIGWDMLDNDSLPYDTEAIYQGHGTHTAGIIAATLNNNTGISGYAPGIKLMPLRLLGNKKDGSGSIEDAVKAIEYAIKNGAQVISASWGGEEYSQILFDAVKKASDANVTFVTAAGNKWANVDSTMYDLRHYPASFDLPNIIAVAASTQDDDLYERSNWGPKSIHIAAPGFEILSTVPGNIYKMQDGTSMATPHVAAAAALVKRTNPSLTPLQIREIIMKSADEAPKIRYLVAAGGRLNIGRAVELAEATAKALP